MEEYMKELTEASTIDAFKHTLDDCDPTDAARFKTLLEKNLTQAMPGVKFRLEVLESPDDDFS